MICKECGCDVPLLLTRHVDWEQVCEKCFGQTLPERLRELNEQRKQKEKQS